MLTPPPIERLVLPGVLPIEVWDLVVDGFPLQRWRHDPSFAARLATAVRDWISLPPERLADPRARGTLERVTHLHVGGGGVTDELLEALARVAPVTTSRDPFAAARAGSALRRGARCADVGQSAIKLVEGGRAWQVERDLARAPLRETARDSRGPDRDGPEDFEAARRSTIEFLVEVLGQPERLVLALPCELDAAGVPRACSYCLRDPDLEVLPALAADTGAAIEVVNDAELAALAALPQLPAGATALVLTIGHGVGAALVQPQG